MIETPRSMRTAVQLMFLGAALTLAGVIFSLLNTSQVHVSIVEGNNKRAAADRLSPAEIETAFHGRVITAAVIGVLAALLWVAMAVLNGKGRSWARNMASVLCAFSAVSFLCTVAAVLSNGGGAVGLVVNALNVMIGVGAIVLLWRPESSDYYEARLPQDAAAPQ